MRTLTLLLLFIAAFQLQAKELVLQNVYGREVTSLNGQWNYIIDPFSNGYYDYRLNPNPNGFFKNAKAKDKTDLVEYNFDTAAKMFIPTDWNTANEQLFFYEGTVWFQRYFNYTPKTGKNVYLYFGAVNYDARVYLNGELMGRHLGGFTPFHFDVTDYVKEGENFIVVMVNNDRIPEGVPTVNADWWNYGGITRDVMLVEESDTFVDDYLVQLDKGRYDRISGYVQLNKSIEGESLEFLIPELKIRERLVTDANGKALFSVKAKPQLWSPERPKSYEVSVVHNSKSLSDLIAFRQIEVKGKEILLNGRSIFLRGISIHEEAPFRQGRATSPEDAKVLLGWAKEMGCNFVRLAHYPHNEHMVREAEKMGLMVWSEIPVYWTIHWDNPDTYANAEKQLNDMIDRDKNRGAVVIWSIANETPHSDARDKFLINLVNYARAKDSSRLISMAMEVGRTTNNVTEINDQMHSHVDIISFNSYLGWYGGKLDDLKTRGWSIPYDKPFFISEFGAGALQGRHGDRDERWTEEYQSELYNLTLRMYDKVEGFAGTSPWILVDFYSPRRQLPGIQDFFNRKGVISSKGVKKKAFYTLKDFYSEKEKEYRDK